jgi:hypothetical protein
MPAGEVARRIARWTALVACVVIAILYLNSAAYSAWAAGGPPTPAPGWWLHRAFAHACFAGVALALGAVAFLLLAAPRRTCTALLLTAVAVVLLVLPSARVFLLEDMCLDSGGVLDAATFACRR